MTSLSPELSWGACEPRLDHTQARPLRFHHCTGWHSHSPGWHGSVFHVLFSEFRPQSWNTHFVTDVWGQETRVHQPQWFAWASHGSLASMLLIHNYMIWPPRAEAGLQKTFTVLFLIMYMCVGACTWAQVPSPQSPEPSDVVLGNELAPFARTIDTECSEQTRVPWNIWISHFSMQQTCLPSQNS